MDTYAIKQLMPVIDGFPRPDWVAIHDGLDVSESEVREAWCEVGRTWLGLLAESAGPSYAVVETDNFLILSSLGKKELEIMKTFVEKARRTILKKLEGIVVDEGFSKHALFLFADSDTYNAYLSHTYPDDDESCDDDRFLDDWVLTADDEIPDYEPAAVSFGAFIDGPYGHIAISHADLHGTESTFAREFTYNILGKTEMPLWLSAGLVETLEHEVCRNNPLNMDASRIANHQRFWNAGTIQEFWSGESFQRPDAGNLLSYELARYCIGALSHDFKEFIEFAKRATIDDAGEEAAIKIFEGSLGGLPYQFFGEGDWIPKPETWWSDIDV